MEKYIRLILANAFIIEILKKIVYKVKKILLLKKIKLPNYQNHLLKNLIKENKTI